MLQPIIKLTIIKIPELDTNSTTLETANTNSGILIIQI